jgi:hypothetical protein
MVQRIIGPSVEDAVVREWNRSSGRRAVSTDVNAGEVPCTCYVRLQRYVSDAERATLKEAILAISPLIEDVELMIECEVPDEVGGRQWVYHQQAHLRSEDA